MDSLALHRSCSDARFDRFITRYCFAELSVQERDQFEIHLLNCKACWREVQRLSDGVDGLKSNSKVMQRLLTPEIIGQFGMSGHLDRPFAGHAGFALGIAGLYGLLHVASVWTELAYSYDRFASLTWGLSPLVFLSISGGTAAALWLAAKAALDANPRGLSLIFAVSLAVVATMTFTVWHLLPATPTIEASFETRSAAAGFLKNELFYFVPLLLFILPTFHAVVGIQGRLRAGHFAETLDLLTGSPAGLPPRGVWLIPVWFLVAVLLAATFIGYAGTNSLLDNLREGPHSNTFAAALYIRVFLWYTVALVCLAWYQRSILELKREAIAASRLISRNGQI